MKDKSVRIVISAEPTHWEVREACESVWYIARNCLKGSVCSLLSRMFGNYHMHPQIDGRTKAGREYNEARDALLKAAERYDAAMRAFKTYE